MTWRLVRRRRRCAFGCVIPARSSAWFGRWWSGSQMVVCPACGERRYGLTPPAPVRAERDGKSAALGGDA